MGYEINWHIPERVIKITGEGALSFEDTDAINTELVSLLEEGTAPVHILLDASHITNIPHDFVKLKSGQTYIGHANLGWLVMFGADRMMSFLASLILQMTRSRIRFCHTEAEALAFLQELEPELISDNSVEGF